MRPSYRSDEGHTCRHSEAQTVGTLRDEFLREALAAPALFSDLANLEIYISETYRGRSFIELIQNADDAGATAFGVHQTERGLLIGNNGREFSYSDVEALSRSGSSKKSRTGGTIGYRGIGFKSTVNLAKKIFVFSGAYSFYFDREPIRRCLPEAQSIPLIRVPQDFKQGTDPLLEKVIADYALKHGYRTIFLFDAVDARAVSDELAAFDRGSLLFLLNLQTLRLELDGVHRYLDRTPHQNELEIGNEILEISEGGSADSWTVFRSPTVPGCSVAFRLNAENEIIAADPAESLIHAFTPTCERSGIGAKINGDFTTDPSRKAVDWDAASNRAFAEIISIVGHLIAGAVNSSRPLPGLFRALNASFGSGQTRVRLLSDLAAFLDGHDLLVLDGQPRCVSEVRIRPEWLNYDDYEAICGTEVGYIPKGLLGRFPDLPVFLESLGSRRLDLSAALRRLAAVNLSPTGRAELLAKVARQYRYDLTAERIAELFDYPLFLVSGQPSTAAAASAPAVLDDYYWLKVLTLAEEGDLRHLCTKLGFSVPRSGNSSTLEASASVLISTSNDEANPRTPILPHENNLRLGPGPPAPGTRWRSAEVACAEHLRQYDDVLSVRDVTAANMGYDLEVAMRTGGILYVEVKSVTTFNEPIKLTNNEYSSAHAHGDNYVLAVLQQATSESRIGFLVNPIANLRLTKQVERWAWVAEDYGGILAATFATVK